MNEDKRLESDRRVYEQANHLYREGKESEAIALLLDLAEKETGLWEVFSYLGNHAFRHGEIQLAREFLDMAILKEPVPGAATMNMVGLLMESRQFPQAALHLKAYLEHPPEEENALELWQTLKISMAAENTEVPRLIAYYLPQFHPIPENDRWWGKGFTEWTNVVRAKPLFSGHDQPRYPTDLGFYDLRVPETREAQAQLARKYGIYGFCYYYYWFANGKRLLERPLEDVLHSGQPDFPFCICWANENWTRIWNGGNDQILMPQDHSDANNLAFIHSLVPFVQDRRYIKVDGKPMILIYHAHLIPDISYTISLWREEMSKQKVGDIYLVAVQSFSEINPDEFGFDASCEFPPLQTLNYDRTNGMRFNRPFTGHVFDYGEMVRHKEIETLYAYKRFKGVMLRWDATPRRGHRAMISRNATPAWYRRWLQYSIDTTAKLYSPNERFVFINAWNEWAEGDYLEPDERYGHAYLKATRDVLLQADTVASPLDKYLPFSGDNPEDDALWIARGDSYVKPPCFHLTVDCESASREEIMLTLDSLLSQTYPRFTCALVGLASAVDDTLQDPRFKEIQRAGTSLIQSGNSPWTMNLRAGDILARRCLHTFAEFIETHAGISCFYSDEAHYRATPWNSWFEPGTVENSSAPVPEMRPGTLGVWSPETHNPGQTRHIPRLLALRKTSLPLQSKKSSSIDLDCPWACLPWKPMPRVVTFSFGMSEHWLQRVEFPLKALRQNHRAEFKILTGLSKLDALASFADAIYLHNPPLSTDYLNVCGAIRQLGALRCIFSFDRNAILSSDGMLFLPTLSRYCDQIIVGGENTAALIRPFHPNIAVIPDTLPGEIWKRAVPVKKAKSGKLRIGWQADDFDAGKMNLLIEIVKTLGHEFIWIGLGYCPDEIADLVAERYDVCPFEDAPALFEKANLDLALVALEEGGHDETSVMRLLQFGACACAVIASDAECHRIGLPVTLLDNDVPSWIAAIRRHLPEHYRQAMAERLLQAIDAHWRLESRILDQWETALFGRIA
ncbi:MAG: glycoside hydrolase family 99-like domain-containing protein [Candidatus Accumulibacter sp.]|jgi:hypothetical protein|nr:glycoside hydrolase family 99-like domain-containing protein [Accumulibacter sp.]